LSVQAKPERLFGTDGVRGVAGAFLSAELALAIGRGAVESARGSERCARPRVLILRDTRASGPMLECALAAGVAAAGGEALLAGVLPTPAAPLLIRSYGFELAAVISASHNPHRDNGIKLFGADGSKLSDQREREIEALLREESGRGGDRAEPGAVRMLHGGEEDYLRALQERFGELSLAELRIALDCANGATYRVAPELFRRLGARVSVIADAPDGRNINDRCGSTDLDALIAFVRNGDFHVGFAFDGDGDRVLAVDHDGAVLDGDEMIAMIATHLARRGELGGGVAVTVMSNLGLHRALEREGVAVVQTPVGDRNVLSALQERSWRLGGEQSGHIIDRSFSSCGDGIATALALMEALGGQPPRAGGAIDRLPQVLISTPVADRQAALDARVFKEALKAEEAALGERGRILVRPSGTEPLVRVMVEAPTRQEAEQACARLAEALSAAR
jgi:phosphoglucosamine mutase